MRVEFFRQGKQIKRTSKGVIGGFSWTNELMYVPTTMLTLPILYREYLNGHDEMKIFINGKVFWGVIKKIVENKTDETVTVYLDHIICEWEYRQISVNNAIKNKNINVVYKGAKTRSAGTTTITASDFTLLLHEVGELTPAQYALRAGATAWTASGSQIPVSVDASQIKRKDGEYDVTFSAGGASVTVKASIREHPKESSGKYFVMSAANFVLPTDGINISDSEYIAKAGASVELTEEGQQQGMVIPPLKVDRSGVRARDGQYSVKYYVTYIDPEDSEEREQSVSATCVVQGDNFADPTIADNISDIYADMNFAHPGWEINYGHGAGAYTVDYVYSRQNKLQALTKTVELTEDLFWRVRFVNEKVVDVSPFGDYKSWMLSKRPSSKVGTRLISDPKITHEFDHVVNCATVYSEKSDTGVSSMTLREVYETPALQKPGFPVVIIRANVNNERDYRMYTQQFPKLAPNNELEYAVIDEESVALESGTLIEGTFAFNDLSPFARDVEEVDDQTHEISDADRVRAAQTAYHAAIKKLKYARRKYRIEFETEELPAWLNVGDRIRLVYQNSLYILEQCSAYERMVLSYNDVFYITKITYHFNEDGAEYNTVILEKELRVDRELAET